MTTSAARHRWAQGRDPKSLSASYAGGPASSSSRPAAPKRSASTDAGRLFVEAVLDRYLWLPVTPARTSRSDRRLAKALYEDGVPLAAVQAALVLGAARRIFRRQDAPPLAPIRTLHYFLPVIEEILELPPAPGYTQYLETKLLPLAEAKAEGSAHTPSG